MLEILDDNDYEAAITRITILRGTLSDTSELEHLSTLVKAYETKHKWHTILIYPLIKLKLIHQGIIKATEK